MSWSRWARSCWNACWAACAFASERSMPRRAMRWPTTAVTTTATPIASAMSVAVTRNVRAPSESPRGRSVIALVATGLPVRPAGLVEVRRHAPTGDRERDLDRIGAGQREAQTPRLGARVPDVQRARPVREPGERELSRGSGRDEIGRLQHEHVCGHGVVHVAVDAHDPGGVEPDRLPVPAAVKAQVE